MNENRRHLLKAFLLELNVQEVHRELNNSIDSMDNAKALELIEVEEAINTLLEYLDK